MGTGASLQYGARGSGGKGRAQSAEKSIGAKRSSLYAMLLSKGAFLGLLGGLLGFGLGTVAALVLGPYIAGLAVRPAFGLLPESVLLSLGVALLGSWLPARSASRVEPFASMQEV